MAGEGWEVPDSGGQHRPAHCEGSCVEFKSFLVTKLPYYQDCHTPVGATTGLHTLQTSAGEECSAGVIPDTGGEGRWTLSRLAGWGSSSIILRRSGFNSHVESTSDCLSGKEAALGFLSATEEHYRDPSDAVKKYVGTSVGVARVGFKVLLDIMDDKLFNDNFVSKFTFVFLSEKLNIIRKNAETILTCQSLVSLCLKQ